MEELKKIKKIVKLVYLSSFLKDEKPLSLILIAPAESSKTHLLLSYVTKYSHLSTDLSYFGLIKLLRDNKKIKQIVIPDFLKVTEKGQSTKKNIVSCLNGFLEEGLYEINLNSNEKINLKGRNGGIITATTKASFFQNRKEWNNTGFKSRFLVVTWNYKNETINKILKIIIKEENTKNIKPKKLSYKTRNIKFNPLFENDLIDLAEHSTRRLKLLKVLLKSISLNNNNTITTKKDLQELKELSYYINMRFKTI